DGCLSPEQIEKFKDSLWRDIDPTQGFPFGYPMYSLFPSAYLKLPYPEGVDVEKLFRQKVFNPNEVIFRGGPMSVNDIPITGGDSCLLNDWLNAFGVFSGDSLSLSDEELNFILGRVETEWEATKGVYSKLGNEQHEFTYRADRLLEILAKIIIPNIIDAVKERVEKLLGDMEQNSVTCLASRIALLPQYPERKDEIFESINRYYAAPNSDKSGHVQLGLGVLLAIRKKRKLDFEVPLDTVAGCIKNRLVPALKTALSNFEYFLKEYPDCVTDQNLTDILGGLDSLRIETALSNEQSHIPDAERLDYRKRAAQLARSLFSYYESRGQKIPPVITEWQKIAESPEEFWEIRNCWKNAAEKF
ncbi:MAG: hypothetical protein ACRC2T_03730, partial [Thermoguttaceae bacterium]